MGPYNYLLLWFTNVLFKFNKNLKYLPPPFFFSTAKICGEDGQVDPNCFVLAQSIVFSAMEQE